jgi:hypothetical protein
LKKGFHFNPYAMLAFGALLGYVLAYLNHLTPHGALSFVFSLVAVGLVALVLRAFRGTGARKKNNDELLYLRYRKRLYEQNRLFAKVCDEARRERPVCN